MNIYKIIKFISDKNPKYEMDNLKLKVRPVKGEGYIDDDGLKQGKWQGYFTGRLDYTITYKDNKKDGYYETYYPNGKIHYKGNFKDGQKDGYWEYYYDNGELESKENYIDGERIG